MTGRQTSTPVQPSITSAHQGEDDGGKGGGVMTPLARTRCLFLKGGVCKEHGEGARKHWKPVMTTFTGPNAEERRKMTKKLNYVCDLDMSPRKKLRQTRLSFGQKQGGDIKGGDTGNYFND